MLDLAHGLVLRAVAGEPLGDHASPALDDLVACRMVERIEGGLAITEVG